MSGIIKWWKIGREPDKKKNIFLFLVCVGLVENKSLNMYLTMIISVISNMGLWVIISIFSHLLNIFYCYYKCYMEQKHVR